MEFSKQFRSGYIKSVKKNKEKCEKIDFFLFRRRLCISVGCKCIFFKYLKLPIKSYFCRPDRVILSRLKKKEKYGKIVFFIFCFVAGFAYEQSVYMKIILIA